MQVVVPEVISPRPEGIGQGRGDGGGGRYGCSHFSLTARLKGIQPAENGHRSWQRVEGADDSYLLLDR